MKRSLLPCLIGLAAMAASTTLSARPAQPGLRRTITLSDGTRLECSLVGDEFGHHYIAPDGRQFVPVTAGDTLYRCLTAVEVNERQAQAEARRTASRRKAPLTPFPTIGEVHGLVILTEFQDVRFQPEYDLALFQRQMNESGYSDHSATGSARDYFISQSDSLFLPQFDVVGPILLPGEESLYGRNNGNGQDSNPALMVSQACQMAHDSLGIDFSQYDFDDNGEVDFVFILYAGYGESYGAVSTTIWPHMAYLNQQYTYLTLDGKSINRYACSCELSGNTGTHLDGIGAFCHEFGHVIGLPDLYNTVYSGSVQLGPWDIMDSGSYNNGAHTPPHYSAFERYSLGWMELTDITEPADTVFVPELNASWQAYRIPTARDDEYFILENRQQQGWDKYQPGCGLMITHIDYDASFWNGNTVNSSIHPHVDLVEADGSQGAPYGTDLYPIAGNDMFTDYSSPSALLWDGTPNERGVSRIRQEADGTITFAYMRDRLKRPVLSDVTSLTDSSFVAHWGAVAEASSYRLHLLELLPDSINPLLLELDGSTLPDDWTGTEVYDDDGDLLRLGSYGVSGAIQSPLVSPLAADDALTLCFDARSYPGKSVNYSVTLSDAAGQVLDRQTLKATRNMERHLFTYTGCPAQARITIETTKERLFIDDLRLVSGLRDTAEVWTVGPAEWSIDSIADLECLVDGLAAERGYQVDVTALDDVNALRSSLPSHTLVVYTLPAGSSSGIGQIQSDTTAVAGTQQRTSDYDMQGRRNTSVRHGLRIVGGRVVWM